VKVNQLISDLPSRFKARWRRLSKHQRIAFSVLPIVLLLSMGVLLKLLSSNAANNDAISQQAAAVNGSAVSDTLIQPESINDSIAEHTASVMTLQRWLLSGRNTKREAGISLTMLQHLQELNADPANEIAWQDYSDELSRLENAVVQQTITTPEATALVASLRYDYAALRDRASSGVIETGAPLEPVSQTTVAQRSSLAPWLFALFPLLASALAAAAWLFYQLSQQAVVEKPAIRTVDSRANQNAILQLLDEMEPLAEGDLRVEATVSEAMTGALADAFNYAVTELRWLVGAIKGSAAQVA